MKDNGSLHTPFASVRHDYIQIQERDGRRLRIRVVVHRGEHPVRDRVHELLVEHVRVRVTHVEACIARRTICHGSGVPLRRWKLPKERSRSIQRAGRAARGLGRKGLAVLLVEPATYLIVLAENQTCFETANDESGQMGGLGQRAMGRSGFKRLRTRATVIPWRT